MSPVSYLMHSPVSAGELLAYAGADKLIATVVPTAGKGDAKNGQYRISWYGGASHGEVSYAKDYDDLNTKVCECAVQFHVEPAA